MSAETAVRFVHSDSGWQWAGPDLTFEDQTKVGPGDGVRFAVAYPPGYEGTLNGLDQLAERQYEQIATLLGLPTAPEAALLLFPDATSLRAHTSLLLPSGQDQWVGFRVVKTVINQELATPQLDGALTQLALAEVGANEAVAPWLWNGLPLALRAQTGTETSAYLAELQASLISDVPEGQDAQDDVLSWAAIEYLRQQVGWHGLGQLAISLGRACKGEGVQADQVGCSNPDALDVALSDVVHMDADTFEAAWRAHWGERLDMMQAGIDAVLSARAEAVLTGDQDAFINTLDSDMPNLVVEERQWFADLAENPVEQFSLTGKPVALLEDGSILTTVTMRYRLARVEGRWDEGTVLRDILFTPANDGYRWAGARLGVVRGERVSVFYPRPNLGPERVGEGYRDLAHALGEEAERMLPALADKLGVDPPSEVTIRLYKNDHVFRTSIALPFPAVEWVPAWANGEASVKIRLDDQAASQEYQAILARYLAWHLLCRMGVDSEWLLKGASTYLAGAVDGGANARQATQSLSKVLDAALEGDLYALAALPPDHQLVSSSEFRIAKSLSYNTTNYLAETYGYQTLLQLLQSQAHDQDVDTVLRSLVGSTLSKFEAEWSESLARGHALPEWIEIARSFDPDAANQHVEYLASRQLAGRQAGSPGAELASAYIAARFVEYGLVPANGVTQTGQEPTPTRFYQRFPITYTTWISSPNLQVHGLDGQVDESLVHRQDFVAIVDQVSGEGSVAGDLLWVRSTDWQGIDLNGKIVVCDASESPQIQVSRAIEHGASGLILIGNKAGRRSVLAKSPLPTTNSLSQTIPTLELTRQGAARLLEAAGQTQGSLAASPPALHLGLKATVDVPLSTPVTVETANVLGLLPGSDPKLSQEIVIVGAHYDHVGDDPGTTGPGTAGRRYAGANDNASGIGVLLEIARLWQETGYRPRRSVLFVAWGAQEPGEIGSTCYVTHPAFPLESTVAVFQLDGVGGGRGYFLEAQGDPAQEGLLRFVLEAAETQVDGRLTLTRPSDRSDDRPFRQAGIPTVLLTWRESSEDNLPAEQADPVESYRLGVTGRMVSLALMTIAR
jgi:hypothetical protein